MARRALVLIAAGVAGRTWARLGPARCSARTLIAVFNRWFESVAVAQQRAKRRLPPNVYGAIVAGAERGATRDDNEAAFDELGLRPLTAGQSATQMKSLGSLISPVDRPCRS